MEITGLSIIENNSTGIKAVTCDEGHITDKPRTKVQNLANLASVISFTTPTIRTGPKKTTAKKGITLAQQQALEDWYIEYYFTDTSMDIHNRRVKYRNNLNSFRTPKEKKARAEELATSLTQLLEAGWHPFNEEVNTRLRNEVVSLSLSEANKLYVEHLIAANLRKKSVQTYQSKLIYFVNTYPTLKVNQITEQKVHTFLKRMQSENKWSARTYNAAHQTLNAFFNYLISRKYIHENPLKMMQRQKGNSSKSDMHKVFNDTDFASIMTYLKTNDSYTELFAKTIYYTCIRPKELRQLKIEMIDLQNDIITIPASISKNKQTDTVKITPNFKSLLAPYNLESLPKSYYLFSTGSVIGGIKPVGENTPYNRFIACLKALNLDDKGYSLYGVKHKSNINKYLGGWTVAEIMKANRHGSISQTETYLRELAKFINIDQKEVPAI